MALQTLYMPMRSGRFAGVAGINLGDSEGAADPGWTTGATLIDSLPISPPLAQQWTLLAWGVTFTGAWARPFATRVPYGKLGALWAGVLTDPRTPTLASAAQPWQTPMLTLPLELTSVQKVWDGTQDPMFPLFAPQGGQFNPPAAMASAENLPQPIPIDAGRPLAFGMWLTPSLVANTLLQIWNASFSIVYDDGIEPQGAP
jgi:hypothetical protein